MNKHLLEGRKIAILISDGFEEKEMIEPQRFFQENGASTYIVSFKSDCVMAMDHNKWTNRYKIDYYIENVDYNLFDVLFIPGGILSVDKLRRDKRVIDFIKFFFEEEKIIAAICHSPSLFIETSMIKGRNLTSFISIKTDLINAGATWKDQMVVVDRNLITAQGIKYLFEFSKTVIKETYNKFKTGKHFISKTYIS